MEGELVLILKDLAGGDDGTRTRDLMRDRPTGTSTFNDLRAWLTMLSY